MWLSEGKGVDKLLSPSTVGPLDKHMYIVQPRFHDTNIPPYCM